MILRIRQPGVVADRDYGPGVARVGGFVAGASRYGLAIASGELAVGSSEYERAREAQRRFRERAREGGR